MQMTDKNVTTRSALNLLIKCSYFLWLLQHKRNCSHCCFLILIIYVMMRSIVMNMSVCVSVCPRGFLRNHTRDLYQILCVLPMSVARSSSGMLMIACIAYRREGAECNLRLPCFLVFSDCLRARGHCCKLLKDILVSQIYFFFTYLCHLELVR